MLINYLRPVHLSMWDGNKFTLVKKGRLASAIRVLFIKLGWIEADIADEIEFHALNIDGRDVMSLIKDQYIHYYHYTGRRPTKIIIGYEQMSQISKMCEPEFIRFRFPDRGVARELMGMQIECNPLIDGFVVTREGE